MAMLKRKIESSPATSTTGTEGNIPKGRIRNDIFRETATQSLQESWRRKYTVVRRRVREKTGWKRRHLGDNQEQDSLSIHRPKQNRKKLREKVTHEEAS
jgi:hypothetical protein